MMDTYICKKCGEELDLDDLKAWAELSCPECSEPIPQEELILRDLEG
jgi:DNA-directed RNA polymerase subunit RPC12/RpoP